MVRRRRPSALIAEQLGARWHGEHDAFLLDLIATAAAALTLRSGAIQTAEILYRFADAAVGPEDEP